ncbi:MAG: pyruvate kinase [Candidatus Dadabacteria bacterium]|nr:MAG: pyruvate kinase [Candidatus Dadabacteria bacterium]
MTDIREAALERKTKLIATVGPASNSEEKLRELLLAGVNVFRLNFSHGTHDAHLTVLNSIRKLSSELDKPVAILQDLSGPKIRISEITGDYIELNKPQVKLKHADGSFSTPETLYVETVDPVQTLKPGDRLLLADGLLQLQAQQIKQDHVLCDVIKGGRIRSRAGVSFPDSSIKLPATTEKDMVDLEWGIENEVDYVALSFVSTAEDVLMVREAIRKKSADCKIIAKIERKSALENIDSILDVSDGLMVARGDLGVELPLEKIPVLQKKLIEKANYRGIPVIVATQMLHSMITSLRPTRAEVSDIATAVMSGADALMLSEETAIGEHPVEALKYLARIANEAEKNFVFSEYKLRLRDADRATVPDAVAYAAAAAANKVEAAAIIACTETGNSARLLAKYRPQQPIYGASSSNATLNRMCLYWGIKPISCASTDSHMAELEIALKNVQKLEGYPNGTRAVITGGLAVRTPGATSVLEIREMMYGE